MDSEIATLLYVAEMTSVPVPKVYGWDLKQDNPVGAMYMLMEMVEGETVEQRIKQQDGITGFQVQKILTQMSRYTAELSSLRFDGIGRFRLTGGSKGDIRWEVFKSHSHAVPLKKAADHFEEKLLSLIKRSGFTEKDLKNVSEEWNNSGSLGKQIIEASLYHRAIRGLASQFTSGPFPLQHPDMNQQNVILNTEGNVKAIIDWENVRTVPFEVYDILQHKLFRQRFEVWEGMEWTDEFAYLAFKEFEESSEACEGRLSRVHLSRMVKVGKLLQSCLVSGLDGGGLPELVRFVIENIGEVAIVPESLATEILEASEN